MRRREFLGLVGGAAVMPSTHWPLAARAQPRVTRVGVLLIGRAVAPRDLPLASELARLGYVEGRNVAYDIRGADGDLNQTPHLARELAALKPDVMVGATSQLADPLARASSDIPILMTVVADPIALGLSSSMSRPTRNITGFTLSSSSLAGKRLELLHELIPNLRRAAYLWEPGPMIATFEQHVRSVADRLGITLVSVPVTTEASVADGFALADRERIQGALIESGPTNVRLSGHIVNECLVRDLPSLHAWFLDVRGGALMSYGPATIENLAGVAKYIDSIVKGAKVAELPFEEPTQFKLAINLRTARSIKITIPAMLLARADEVIE